MIAQENGLLPIVNLDGADPWSEVLTVASPHLDQRGLERIKTALDGRTKSVAIERHYIDKDYRDTFTNFHSKKFSTPDSRCIRLHFFGNPIDHKVIRDGKTLQQHYLGYSVIRPTRPNCVGRTLLEPGACALTNCHISLCTEEVSIQGAILKVSGFPFISQDADVTVCAQSALWMLARYFSNRYRIHPEIYPFRLTDLTRDFSIGRLIPSGGLYIWQMAEALRQIGYAPVIYERQGFSDSFEHLMYTYIESGIPILAAFHNHVVVLFGHRSDFSAPPAPETMAQKFSFSSQFNREFVGNDDNGFPYQILGVRPTPNGIPRNISDVQQFIAALPEKVFLPAESFQTVVTSILDRSDVGYKKLSPKIATNMPVLRLFLTTGRSFKKALGQRSMGNISVQDAYRSLPLPHFIWVCEISHPGIYPNEVLGEIIWDATRNPYEPDGWIAVHYPEVLILDAGSALNGKQNLLTFPINSSTNYPIFESNLVRP